MINLSMKQTLSLWTDLEEARHGTNSYGGDTAEIYAYRLMPHTPMCDMVKRNPGMLDDDSMAGEIAAEVWRDAKKSLVALLHLFSDAHPEVSIDIDGRPLAEWALTTDLFTHRCHVQILKG